MHEIESDGEYIFIDKGVAGVKRNCGKIQTRSDLV
jgi:hypothetical protein